MGREARHSGSVRAGDAIPRVSPEGSTPSEPRISDTKRPKSAIVNGHVRTLRSAVRGCIDAAVYALVCTKIRSDA